MDMPPYNTALVGEWEASGLPPFEFRRVTMRIFPLRADAGVLGELCDRYLNQGPAEAGRFEPALPFVYLSILNYGKMTSEAANLGWVSQDEVAFIVPLLWRRREGGRMVFHDWASFSPYIFVDNGMSVTTGREVYGWPKQKAWFAPEISSWATHLHGQRCLLDLSTTFASQGQPRQTAVPQPLLHIERRPTASPFQWPPRPGEWPDPLSLTRAMGEAMELTRDWVALAGSAAVTDPGSWPAAALAGAEIAQITWPFLRLPGVPPARFNVINLKQFRGAERHEEACYQALTNTPIEVVRYHASGLFGGPRTLAGDLSAGFRLALHHREELPISRHLGLLPEERGDRSRPFFKPVMPFWVDLQMRLPAGETLCWRGEGRGWAMAGSLGEPGAGNAPYDTATGGTQAPLPGPFRFPDTTLRAFAFQARADRLQNLADAYLNDSQQEFDFEVAWPLVFLLATSYGDRQRQAGGSWWLQRDLAFAVPLRRTPRGGDGEPEAVMMLPYVWGDSSISTVTLREVAGLPAIPATLTSPPDPWMDSWPRDLAPVLSLITGVFPALYQDERELHRVLLQLLSYGPRRDGLPPAELPPEVAAGLDAFLGQMDDGLLRYVTLKQYRDVAQPERACYQALVRIDTPLELHEQGRIEESLEMHVRGTPSQPIVETLGLEVASTEIPEGEPPGHPWLGLPMHVLRPVAGWWFRLSVDHLFHNELSIFPPPQEASG